MISLGKVKSTSPLKPQRTRLEWGTRCPFSFCKIQTSGLADFFAPGFEILFHLSHELIGDGAIDQAVIVTEREVNDAANGDGVVAVFVGDDERHFSDAADAHDGGVWLVDDRETKDGAELTGVGDGEGGTFDVIGFEFLAAGAFAEIGDAALESEEIEVSGVFDDGYDESP